MMCYVNVVTFTTPHNEHQSMSISSAPMSLSRRPSAGKDTFMRPQINTDRAPTNRDRSVERDLHNTRSQSGDFSTARNGAQPPDDTTLVAASPTDQTSNSPVVGTTAGISKLTFTSDGPSVFATSSLKASASAPVSPVSPAISNQDLSSPISPALSKLDSLMDSINPFLNTDDDDAKPKVVPAVALKSAPAVDRAVNEREYASNMRQHMPSTLIKSASASSTVRGPSSTAIPIDSAFVGRSLRTQFGV